MTHDVYVYNDGRKWYWRCVTCTAVSPTSYPRRMDADDAAYDHGVGRDAK